MPAFTYRHMLSGEIMGNGAASGLNEMGFLDWQVPAYSVSVLQSNIAMTDVQKRRPTTNKKLLERSFAVAREQECLFRT